jgi:hypothetical protein
VGGSARGRRHATLQINYSYALLLSANFQGFCRDLHTEAALYLADRLMPTSLRHVWIKSFVLSRRLDTGNPNPGNLGSDFNRFGLDFWAGVHNLSPKNSRRRENLEELNSWRNAIAHHDFSRLKRSTFCVFLRFGFGDEHAIALQCRSIECYPHTYNNTLAQRPGKRADEMAQKKIYKSTPCFRVGDKVKFKYVAIPVVTEISEDRGNLESKGQRVYGLWFTFPDSEPAYLELPEEDLEPAN